MCFERGCNRGMISVTCSLVVVNAVLTLGQRRTGGPALNNTCVKYYLAEMLFNIFSAFENNKLLLHNLITYHITILHIIIIT